jgi:hypothetical protein
LATEALATAIFSFGIGVLAQPARATSASAHAVAPVVDFDSHVGMVFTPVHNLFDSGAAYAS